MRKIASVFVLMVSVAVIGCAKSKGDGPGPTATAKPDPTPARTVNPGQHGPIASGDFSLKGALDVSGKYSVLYPFFDPKTDTCAEIAGADAKRYVAPLPTFLDEQRFTWVAGLNQYAGPGSYDLKNLQTVRLTIRKNAKAKAVDYSAGKSSVAKLSVNKDNGGFLEFKDLKDSAGEKVSGKASWKCSEGSKGKT